MLQQVFTNLRLNAIQAMPKGEVLTLRTSSGGGGDVRVDVIDTGTGISQENLQKLFTPFFSTKKEVKGVGLGLAVSYGIIQQHQGRKEVSSEEGKGSTFSVFLKAFESAAPSGQS
jgi:signal transduction histidine kinase